MYDFDGSKVLTRDELVILMTNVLSSMKAMRKQPPPNVQEVEQKTDEFFRKADADGDKKITLKEFKDYVTKDQEILGILLSAEVAKSDDFGADFGTGAGGVPACDKDLEAECCPKQLEKSLKRQNIKDGNDASVGTANPAATAGAAGGLIESDDVGSGD